MVNGVNEGTSCCFYSTTFPKIGAGLALALAVTAVALLAIGHLKMQELIEPGEYVAAACGGMTLLSLGGYGINRYATARFTTYLEEDDPSGFKSTVYRTREDGFGIVLDHQQIQLNPNDIRRLDLQPGQPALFNEMVYTVCASNNVEEGSIGVLPLKPRVGKIPSNGLVRPFNDAVAIAGNLSVYLYYSDPYRTLQDEVAFYYDDAYLRQQLNQKLHGQIFTNLQPIHTTLDQDITLMLVVFGIPQGQYYKVEAQTNFVIHILDKLPDNAEVIPMAATTPLAEATFTFRLISGAKCDTNILLPHLQTKMKKMKSKQVDLPKTASLVLREAFWKVNEKICFTVDQIEYVFQLEKIATNGRTYQYAVTERHLTPREILFQ